jgi:hypothetical protein
MLPTASKGGRIAKARPSIGLFAMVAILGTISGVANATTYYLDPNGNDVTGNGTSASPWKTLYKAGQAVPANQGHVIHLKPGTYLLDKSLNAYGTSDAVWLPPGTIIEGENTASNNNVTVVLSHQNASFPGFGINISTGNFETTPGTMRNLTVDGDNFYGVGGNASDPGGGGVSLMKISNYTFDNVTIRNFNGSGLRLCVTGTGQHTTGQDISNVEVKNCKFSKTKGYLLGGDGWKGMWIHDSLFDNSDIPNASLDNPSPWGDCVNVNWVGATRINNCTMYAPNYTFPFPWPQQRVQDTICFFWATGGNEIDHNNLYQWVTLPSSGPLNGYDRILKLHDNNIIQTLDRDGEGIELMLSHTDVYNNYISGFPMGVLTDAGGVNAGDTSSDVVNVRIYNNVFRNPFPNSPYEGYGVCFGNGNNTTLNNWAIYNNVFDGYDYGLYFSGSYITNLNVKNNAFLNNGRIINWNYPTAPISNSTIAYNVFHYTDGFDRNPGPSAGANVAIVNNLPGGTTSLATAGASGLNLSGSLPSPYYAPSSGTSLVVNAGTATISPTITLTGFTGSAPDIGAYEWTGSGGGTPNAAPTVTAAASASPNPVTTGTITTLSALGADDGGEASLTYTWATVGAPPAGVSFSRNGTNAAKSATATFTKAGAYTFRVTIADTGGLTVTSDVSVTVQATATSVVVSPGTVTLNTGATQQFTATVRDQFATAISGASVTWSATSGSVSSSGLYTAPGSGGSATVTATSGSLSGSASVTITAPSAPAAPSGLVATAGNAQIVLSWNPSSGATSYVIRRSTTSGGPYTTVASGLTATTYTDAGLANGTTYYYVVAATNAAGTSPNSSQASATPAATSRYEAENGTLSGGANFGNTRPGYSGTGFVSIGFLGGVTWNNVSASSAGTRTLRIRY